ncbi:PREDICTED: uncharacterized protein LOC107604012 [Ficedula albicollis]|uniref:uncharacterized protein LOC107604012 n=1 Tax=Ficedula albicollis TaxID=59894 RepID=UPI0007AD942F|nr:PREDICTED: uncharacterized protein LOC107604012 [Ficedula albicollis]
MRGQSPVLGKIEDGEGLGPAVASWEGRSANIQEDVGDLALKDAAKGGGGRGTNTAPGTGGWKSVFGWTPGVPEQRCLLGGALKRLQSLGAAGAPPAPRCPCPAGPCCAPRAGRALGGAVPPWAPRARPEQGTVPDPRPCPSAVRSSVQSPTSCSLSPAMENSEVESDMLRRVRALLRELDGHHPSCQTSVTPAQPSLTLAMHEAGTHMQSPGELGSHGAPSWSLPLPLTPVFPCHALPSSSLKNPVFPLCYGFGG